MPGLVGIVNQKPPEINEVALQKMIDAMHCEDFYLHGSYLNTQEGVFIGWCCHKDSFADCMPVFNEKRNIVLFFNGENHADKQTLDDLKRKNHHFNPWNASYLVHLYEEYGQQFFNKLNGWFSGFLLDLRDHKSYLFNDRYGMQRIYLYEEKDSFYFASEAKSILAIRPELKAIPDKSLEEFIRYECVFDNRTLFRNIYLLPGGSNWVFSDSKIVGRPEYFDQKTYEEQPLLEEESFYIKLKRTLRKILPRYVRSQNAIAFSLTGGLDTRLILANMDIPSGRVQSYTLGGSFRECHDVRLARKISDLCGLKHHSLRLDPDFLENFSSYAEKTISSSDGYMDISGAPSVYLHNKARDIGAVRLTGNYGGQVLKGIFNIKPVPKSILETFLNEDFLKHSEGSIRKNEFLQMHPLSAFLFKQAPWFHYGRFACEESQMIQRSPFMDNDLISVLYQATPGSLKDREITGRLIAEGSPELAQIPTDRGLYVNHKNIIPGILRIIREFQIKIEYYYSYGMPQWLARLENVFQPLSLENLVLEQHKYYNMRMWYRDDLSHYVKAILLDDRSLNRPYLNRGFVVRMVDEHVNGYRNHTLAINMALSLELSYRHLIEGGV
jgi:asparagine synthase (glutamine-hydrolysing)